MRSVGHVDDGVHALRDLVHGLDVADVAAHQRHARILAGFVDVVQRAAIEVVEDHDLRPAS